MLNIQAYKAPRLVAAVIISFLWIYDRVQPYWSFLQTVMRNLGVQDLPPQHETGWCTILESVIAKALTDMHCYMKAQMRGYCTISMEHMIDQVADRLDFQLPTRRKIATTLQYSPIQALEPLRPSPLALQMWLAFLVSNQIPVQCNYIKWMSSKKCISRAGHVQIAMLIFGSLSISGWSKCK